MGTSVTGRQALRVTRVLTEIHLIRAGNIFARALNLVYVRNHMCRPVHSLDWFQTGQTADIIPSMYSSMLSPTVNLDVPAPSTPLKLGCKHCTGSKSGICNLRRREINFLSYNAPIEQSTLSFFFLLLFIVPHFLFAGERQRPFLLRPHYDLRSSDADGLRAALILLSLLFRPDGRTYRLTAK